MKKIAGLIVIGLLASCQSTQPVVLENEPIKRKQAAETQVPDARKKIKIIRDSSSVTPPGKKALAQNVDPDARDGAPTGPAPVSFKKVHPVAEPLSRYGNRAAYQVNDHHYEVMTSASGYRARGLASWYGTKFHQRKTSSGVDYDLYELTAAHKTLPLPTYVRVKNLNNGKVITVKVTDRGPFHEGRIIDLSYGAATKLGLLPKGTAPVEIEALTVKGAHEAHYYLQAGAFNSPQLAQSLQAKLAKLTPSPVFIEKYNAYFVVSVGPFANKQMTDSFKMTLASKGVTGVFSLLK